MRIVPKPHRKTNNTNTVRTVPKYNRTTNNGPLSVEFQSPIETKIMPDCLI
jgi:hypothetical protein